MKLTVNNSLWADVPEIASLKEKFISPSQEKLLNVVKRLLMDQSHITTQPKMKQRARPSIQKIWKI